MFAVLGKDITFEIVGSPSSLRIARAYDYAMHKVVQAPPRLQWIANDLAELDLELTFHVRFTHPLAQLNAVYAAANDHLARALVFGNGVHRGYWVITNVEEKPGHLADDGSIISLAVNVTLQEWVRAAEVAPSAPPNPTTPPLAVVTVPTVPAAPLGVPGLGTAGGGPPVPPLTPPPASTPPPRPPPWSPFRPSLPLHSECRV